MSQQNQPTGTLPEKVVDYVGVTSAAMEKMAAEIDAVNKKRQKCAELIPQVVDALVSGERITEQQREKAATMCADHEQALKMLLKVAVHRNAGEQSLGTPTDGGLAKMAGANGQQFNSLNDPHVGRKTGRVKQSDAVLFTGMGLPIPQEDQ